MKSLLILSVVFSLLSPEPVAPKKHVRLFLLSGQSNMAGADSPVDQTPPSDDQIWFRNSIIAPESVPVDEWTFLNNMTWTGFGLEKTFAEEMQRLYPDDIIAILKSYKPGASLSLWVDSNQMGWDFLTDRIDSVVQDLDAKVADGTIASWGWSGLVWMQGESDAADGASVSSANHYRQRFHGLVATIRDYVEAPDLPTVAARIFKFDARENLSTGPWHNLKQVRWAEARVDLDIHHATWLNTDDLPMLYNEPHYFVKNEMGLRFAHGYRNLIYDEQKPFRPFRSKVVWTSAVTYERPTEEWLHITEGEGQLTLDWDYALYADTYTVRYGTDPSNLTQMVTGITENQTTLTSLNNGTTYYVAVQSENTDGVSAFTPIVSGVPASSGNTAPWIWLQDLKHFPDYKEWLNVNDTLSLDATVRDADLSSATYLWEKISGPATVSFSQSTAMDTTATFPMAGTYILRFTAHDGALSSTQDLTVNVNDEANQPPVVDLGGGVGVEIPEGITMTAEVYDDQTPTRGIWTYGWEKVSGPGVVTLTEDTNRSSTAHFNFSEEGTYVIRHTANDSELTGSDDRDVFVHSGPNLARGKPATQSSTPWGPMPASVCVDGVIESESLSHTGNDLNAWWEVDLESVQPITKIQIFNRTGPYQSRLDHYYVLASADPFTSHDLSTTLAQPGVWSELHTEKAAFPTEITLSMPARYIRIQLNEQDYLHMTEVQVLGE